MRYPALMFGAAVLLLTSEFPARGQYPDPGGYPPGSYPPGSYPPGRYPGQGGPGLPFPRRGKKNKTKNQEDQQEQFQTVKGTLRQLDEKTVVVEAQDTRMINLKRTANTKFFKED